MARSRVLLPVATVVAAVALAVGAARLGEGMRASPGAEAPARAVVDAREQDERDRLPDSRPARPPSLTLTAAPAQTETVADGHTEGAAPAPPTPFAPLLTPVQAPQLRLDGVTDAAGTVKAVRRILGVDLAASVTLGTLRAAGGRVLTVAAVRPRSHWKLTPRVPDSELPAWRRLQDGDLVVSPDAARRLRLRAGQSLAGGRVGGIATEMVPSRLDGVLSRRAADRAGLRGPTSVLVSLVRGTDPQQVADQVRARTGTTPVVLAVEVPEPPAPTQEFVTGDAARGLIEPFRYAEAAGGRITIDADWVDRYIVTEHMPVLDRPVTCHRLMIPQLRGALTEIAEAGLADLIDPGQYAGCFVARHIDWDASRPLSMHAWGLAADFNVSTNQLGARPQMDPRIVDIFERWGFNWGGRWRRPDGMHFELGAVLRD